MPEQERFEPILRGFEVPHRVLAPPTQIPNGLIRELWDVDRAEIAAAHQAGERGRVAPIRLHPIAGLPWDERRRHDVAAEAFAGEISIQPVAARPRLVNEDEGRALRLELADQFVDIALARTDGAERYDVSATLVERVSHRNGLFVNIETDIEGLARLAHG